ncbi:MAG: nodulation protein NfeD [Bacteroidetes bacterium]|nr:nodulation protein NfeD [Bacteroidota bacterium]
MKTFLTILLSLIIFSTAASASNNSIHLLKINGSINPTTYDYLKKGIQRAEQSEARAVIIELNTPGGLLQSTRDIVTEFLNAKVPVVVYVSPAGSRAASAGVFITLAANFAVMAPGTNIGAAHPVSTQGEMDSVMSGKVTNDAAAFIRTISEKRQRNIAWAENAVRNSVSITETEALKEHVIDFIAPSLNALLDSLDGKKVIIENDTLTLATKNVTVENKEMGWQHKLLDTLSDPNISYILFLIGIYGLFFELYNPGSIFPGVAGAISIILALYSMQTLSINYAGLALIVVGIILFILEIKITSYGLLSIGGVISLFFGSIMLFQSEGDIEFVRVSLSVVIPLVIGTALFFFFVIGAGVRAQSRKVTTGESAIIGSEALTLTKLNPKGKVQLQGETWSAESLSGDIEKNVNVIVTEIQGLLLKVKK